MVFSAGISQRKKTKEITRKSDLGKESVSPLLSQAQRCQAGRHWPRAGGHGLFRPGDLPRCTVCSCLVTPTLCPQEGISSSARSLRWSFWMAGMGGGAEHRSLPEFPLRDWLLLGAWQPREKAQSGHGGGGMGQQTRLHLCSVLIHPKATPLYLCKVAKCSQVSSSRSLKGVWSGTFWKGH